MRIIAAIALLLAITAYAEETKIIGLPLITDGDILEIEGETIRLAGIDALEQGQLCRTEQGQVWACGPHARAMLGDMIGASFVHCIQIGVDHDGRVLGICSTEEMNLNMWMVAQGLALSDPTIDVYAPEEQRARKRGNGAWSGEFVLPWDFRTGVRLLRDPHEFMRTEPRG